MEGLEIMGDVEGMLYPIVPRQFLGSKHHDNDTSLGPGRCKDDKVIEIVQIESAVFKPLHALE